MKKALILVAALLIAFSSHAKIGIVAGITSSSSNLQSAYLNAKDISQYHFGLTYKLELGRFMDLQPSLIYNVKGTGLSNVTEDPGSFNVALKTGFIEIPLQLQAGINIGNLIRVYGLVEPFVGYAVSHMLDENYDSTWDLIKSRFEYGIGLGAGVALFTHVQFTLKYFWNFGNLHGVGFYDVREVLGGEANGIELSVAFLF